MIKEGDQIVCVNDVFDARSIQIIPHRPVKDTVYTVREIRYYDMHDKTGVLLKELRNPKNVRDFFGKTQEPSFNIVRFVPLNKTTAKEESVKHEEAAI